MKLLDLRFTSPNELRAVFGFSYVHMPHVALTVTVYPGEDNKEKIFAEVVKIIEVVPYCHNHEHCPECSWNQLMAIVNRCRASVPVVFGATSVTIKIRDQVIADLTQENVFPGRSHSDVAAGMPGGLLPAQGWAGERPYGAAATTPSVTWGAKAV